MGALRWPRFTRSLTMGIGKFIKNLFHWFCLMPNDDEIKEPECCLHANKKTRSFELWAFGRVDSHNFEHRERERLWNQLHGSDYFFISDEDYFQQHMKEIVEIWKKESGQSEPDEV